MVNFGTIAAEIVSSVSGNKDLADANNYDDYRNI